MNTSISDFLMRERKYIFILNDKINMEYSAHMFRRCKDNIFMDSKVIKYVIMYS